MPSTDVAIDDQTAINATVVVVEVVSEDRWKLFNPKACHYRGTALV
jgi:hypothetical protein